MRKTWLLFYVALAALPVVLLLGRTKPRNVERSDRYAFLVGIGNDRFRLPYSAVQNLSRTFHERLGIPEDNIVVLVNGKSDLSSTQILTQLDQFLDHLPSSGTVFIYMGGHGTLNQGKSAWLLPDHKSRNSFSHLKLQDVNKRLASHAVANVIGFYELCRVDSREPYSWWVHAKLENAGVAPKDVKPKFWFSGFSCRDGESSWSSQDGRGEFDKAIDDALQGEASDGKDVVTLGGLYKWVQKRVWSEIRLQRGMEQIPTGYILAGTAAQFNELELDRVARPEPTTTANYHGQMLKGYDLMWNRNFDGARESFLIAASMSPEQARPWEEMAEIAWQQKDVAAAALYEAHAATCDPKRATLWNTLGQYQIYAGLPSQAHGSFQQAIKLRPHWATAWLWDSVAFDKMKRPVEAEAAIRNSIRLNPRWPSSHLQLIRFLNAWRRFPELEVAVKDALRYCPNDAGNLEAAVNYYQSVKLRPNEAVHFAQRWVDVQPTSVAARERLILCLFSCKRNLEAQKQYKELERLRGQGKLKGDK